MVFTTPANDGAWAECKTCGMQFAVTTSWPLDPLGVYSLAYSGDMREAGMRDFFLKLAMRSDADAAGVPAWKVLSTAHHAAIASIRGFFPVGGTIFDIGCGTGYFLRAARDLGYAAYGLDVALPVVDLLRSEGFTIWHGTIDSVPEGWVDPKVCTSFFMMHHLPDPVGFIQSVRRRFPRALLIVAVHNDLDRPRRTVIGTRSQPPRAYGWWGKRQLALALRVGGYHSIVEALPARAREGGLATATPIYSSLIRRMPSVARRLLALYYHTLPVWGWPKAIWMRWRGFRKYVLAVGAPMSMAAAEADGTSQGASQELVRTIILHEVPYSRSSGP